MAYFLGAIFPFLLLLLGVGLIVAGLAHQPVEDGLVIAGAILRAGVLVSFSVTEGRDRADNDERGRDRPHA